MENKEVKCGYKCTCECPLFYGDWKYDNDLDEDVYVSHCDIGGSTQDYCNVNEKRKVKLKEMFDL